MACACTHVRKIANGRASDSRWRRVATERFERIPLPQENIDQSSRAFARIAVISIVSVAARAAASPSPPSLSLERLSLGGSSHLLRPRREEFEREELLPALHTLLNLIGNLHCALSSQVLRTNSRRVGRAGTSDPPSSPRHSLSPRLSLSSVLPAQPRKRYAEPGHEFITSMFPKRSIQILIIICQEQI